MIRPITILVSTILCMATIQAKDLSRPKSEKKRGGEGHLDYDGSGL